MKESFSFFSTSKTWTHVEKRGDLNITMVSVSDNFHRDGETKVHLKVNNVVHCLCTLSKDQRNVPLDIFIGSRDDAYVSVFGFGTVSLFGKCTPVTALNRSREILSSVTDELFSPTEKR